MVGGGGGGSEGRRRAGARARATPPERGPRTQSGKTWMEWSARNVYGLQDHIKCRPGRDGTVPTHATDMHATCN